MNVCVPPRAFCYFNNVALAAKALTAKNKRVLIVDWVRSSVCVRQARAVRVARAMCVRPARACGNSRSRTYRAEIPSKLTNLHSCLTENHQFLVKLELMFFKKNVPTLFIGSSQALGRGLRCNILPDLLTCGSALTCVCLFTYCTKFSHSSHNFILCVWCRIFTMATALSRYSMIIPLFSICRCIAMTTGPSSREQDAPRRFAMIQIMM